MKSFIGKFLLVFSILCLGQATFAVSVGRVIGQVIEKETNKPVAFAEITFENNMDKMVVTANEYGIYYAEHLPTGKYKMSVVYNSKTFFLKTVRVYDNYSNEVNFFVSNNTSLPEEVQIEKVESKLSALNPNNITLNSTEGLQATQQLGDVLVMQPGLDIRDGKLYIKGSDQVRFFIDGTPVLGQPTLQRVW